MPESQLPPQAARSSKRTRVIIGGAIIVAVIAWLILSNAMGSSTPYLEVSVVKAAGPSDQLVRAVGNAHDIEWDAQSMLLRFEIADDLDRLPVVFPGVRPDMLVEDARAVVEGRLTSSGVFEATKVLLQCPSKYEEE